MAGDLAGAVPPGLLGGIQDEDALMEFDIFGLCATLQLVENTPWGDIESALNETAQALTLAMQVSQDAFRCWEQDAANKGLADEFSVNEAALDVLGVEWRIAHLARLIRTAALNLGIGTELSGDAGAYRTERDAPAFLLRRLCDIAAPSPHTPRLWGALTVLGRSIETVLRAPPERQGWYLLQAEQRTSALQGELRRFGSLRQGPGQ